MRAARALDALNFFLADVRTGLGPYLAVYLLTVEQWSEERIGIVMSIAGIAGLVAETPAGALIDATRWKRAVLAAAALLVTAGSLLLPLWSNFYAVALSQAVVGAAGAVFPPAVAAISLGLAGPAAFSRRTGRNEAFNHAGNAFAALLVAGTALRWGPVTVFPILAGMAVASLLAAWAVPADGIDHDLARGFLAEQEAEGRDQPSGFRVLLECRPLLLFAACVLLFHLANAAMLPLVGQKLALRNLNAGTALMSACIIAAQLVMVPMAMMVGAKSDAWGRKPIFLAGFAILPIRGVLYTLSDDPYWLVGVQLLDGIGAGIFGALFPIVVADLTRGTGRFNVSQGAVATAQGVGASLSNMLAGFIVAKAGFGAAFLSLAAIAAGAMLLFWLTVPETRESPRTAGRAKAEAAALEAAAE